jgi:hypothetical protein
MVRFAKLCFDFTTGEWRFCPAGEPDPIILANVNLFGACAVIGSWGSWQLVMRVDSDPSCVVEPYFIFKSVEILISLSHSKIN